MSRRRSTVFIFPRSSSRSLSVITERGGARADELHRALVLQGGFPNVDQPTLVQVLRCMGAADLIEQTPEGLLITGLRGEKIVRHHDFYVAFIVHEEYRVNHAGHHIGNVAFIPEFQEDQLPHSGRAPVENPRHRSRAKSDRGRAFSGRASSRFSSDQAKTFTLAFGR